MTIEQALIKVLGFGPNVFIEKSIEGGWDIRKGLCVPADMDVFPSLPTLAWTAMKEKALLDPLAWEAVGKVVGWYCEPHNESTHDALMGHRREECADWKRKMHLFIDALCETV